MIRNKHITTAISSYSTFVYALLITLGLPSASQAQDAKIKFERISLEQGLSQSVVTCILQDSRGFMWFGTLDGLNKYDGYGFTVYKYDPLDSSSLSDNSISAIYEDDSGRLWIGTRAGLNKFDRKTEKFTRYQHDPANPHSLSHNAVTSIYADSPATAGRNMLWIGTFAGGLNKLVLSPADGGEGSDRQKEQFVHFKHDPKNPSSLSHDRIWSIYEDQSGSLWITTIGGGLSRLSRDDREKEQFIRYQHDPPNPTSLSHNTARPIVEDKSGTLWIGTSGGLSRLIRDDREKETFVHYPNDPADPNSLSNNDVWSIYEDQSGTLWIGTYGGGLNKFSKEKEKFAHVKKDPANPNSLGHNMVMSICEDHTGTLWIGTGGGGLDKLDAKSRGFINYRHNPADPYSLSNDGVAAIYEDRSGTLWIGTGEGLNKLDRDRGRFIRYQHDPANPHSLSAMGVSAIYEDDSGTLWIGTGNGGLNKLDKANERFVHYQHDPANPSSISDNTVYAIFENDAHSLWIGTTSGLNKFDKAKEQFIHYSHDPANPKSLSNNRIFSIYADPDSAESVLWIGTWGGGLNRFDIKSETFSHFTERDGLPNGVIYGILGDNGGNLWLSTNRGLSNFDPKTKTFRNYDVDDGLQSNEFNQGAYFKSKAGEMFLGGINGFNRFYPDRVKDNPHVPPVVLTAFKKFDKLVELDTAIAEVKEIKLSYKDNFFSFTFAALDYTNPNKNQYAYKLEGFDSDWIYCGTRRYASYTNLDGGEYLFRVKGSNNDGVWNEEGITIKIIVTPPFWKTWWFLALTAFSVAFAGYVFYRQRLDVKLQQARIVNELRTAHDTQMRLMPTSDPIVEGFDISGVCKPADEVGGDYFDYLWLDDQKTRLGIVIVDVSGKAMKGAMTAVMTSGMVKSEAGSNQSPRRILQKINKAMYRKTDANVFTTMLFAVIDIQNKTLTFANAGQAQPMLKRDDTIQYLKVKGARFPLGVQRDVEYGETTLQLQPNDLLIFYTDGLPEAMNEDHELFDFERMERSIHTLSSPARAAEVVQKLLGEVTIFAGNAKPHDDLTIVVVRVL
jgi:serine phosphatase RsbU (regulator of sigma subunit)/ligand-binding sensor domain-containing protein